MQMIVWDFLKAPEPGRSPFHFLKLHMAASGPKSI